MGAVIAYLGITSTKKDIPDSKVHVANMWPIWGRQDPGGPHVGPMNFAIWDSMLTVPESEPVTKILTGCRPIPDLSRTSLVKWLYNDFNYVFIHMNPSTQRWLLMFWRLFGVKASATFNGDAGRSMHTRTSQHKYLCVDGLLKNPSPFYVCRLWLISYCTVNKYCFNIYGTVIPSTYLEKI